MTAFRCPPFEESFLSISPMTVIKSIPKFSIREDQPADCQEPGNQNGVVPGERTFGSRVAGRQRLPTFTAFSLMLSQLMQPHEYLESEGSCSLSSNVMLIL